VTEQELHRATVELLRALGWRFCHPANGGYRRRVEAAILHGLGVEPGVPDLLVFEEHAIGGHGVALELKSEKGRVTPAQESWLDALDRRGWLVSTPRNLDQVIATLQDVRPYNGRLLP
jgi:hypothetical protein